jgi:hypothetical protein
VQIFSLPVVPDINGRALFAQYGPAAVDVVAPGVVFSDSFRTKEDEMNRFRLFRGRLQMRMVLVSLVLAVVLPVSAYLSVDRISARNVQEPPIFGETWARTELFFGTSKPDGSAVSDEEFKRFLDQEITPRFPDGLTLLTGFGQFKNSKGVIIQERSKLLILLYPLDDTGASIRIEEIRDAYVRMFQQESVLRVESRAGASF